MVNLIYKLYRLFIKETPKKSYYTEKLSVKYRYLAMFQDVLKDINSTQLKTDVQIGYNSEIGFDASIFKVIKTLGFPSQWVKLKKFKNYEILLYKTSIYNLKIKDELHFINGKLVFFSNNFPYVNINHNNIIEILLREKYIPTHKEFKELPNYKIYDEAENFIFTTTGGCLSINYMTGDKKMQEIIHHYSRYEERKKNFKESNFRKLLLEKI